MLANCEERVEKNSYPLGKEEKNTELIASPDREIVLLAVYAGTAQRLLLTL